MNISKVKIALVIGAFIASFYPISAGANMFPINALTVFHETTGTVEYELLPAPASSSPYTLLNVNMKQSGVASNTLLLCGSTVIVKNYAKETAEVDMNYVCPHAVNISKTGNDSSFLVLTYVPYNIATTNQPSIIVGTIQISSTSHDRLLKDADDQSLLPVYASMTAGDMGIIALLFVLIVLSMLAIFLKKI